MPDGKTKIEIEIAAVGGDAAASEIKKPAEALDRTSQSFEKSTKDAAKANSELASSSNSVTASSASMRSGLMNVGYQVQDFAVQVASGTSASRAFAQQAPQLLSGFGLIGVAAGTAVALGAPFLEQMLGFEAAADKAGPAFDELSQKMGKTAAAKAKLETSKWVDSLSQEEEKIREQNEALDRNRKLLEAKLEAQAKLDGANAERQIAEIDADNSLSDEEKIKRKAAVRERMERKKVEDQVNSEGRSVAADEAAAKSKNEEAKRLADIASRISAEKALTENELVDAERRERQREAAKKNLPSARERLSDADKKEFVWGSNPLRSDEDKATARDEAESARRYVEILENQAMANPENVTRTAGLRAKKQALDEAEEKARQDAKKAESEAARKTLDAAARREGFESNKETITQTYQAEEEARRIRTNQQAEEARKRAEENAEREAEKKRRESETKERRENRIDSSEFRGGMSISSLGMNAAREAQEMGNTQGASMLMSRAEALMHNPTDRKTQDELLRLMERFVSFAERQNGRSENANDDSRMKDLERKLRTLEYQIKNNRR